MYDHKITIQEIADYLADMAEMAAIDLIPSEEDIESMALAMA